MDDDGRGRTDECANGEANFFDRPRTAPLRNVLIIEMSGEDYQPRRASFAPAVIHLPRCLRLDLIIIWGKWKNMCLRGGIR